MSSHTVGLGSKEEISSHWVLKKQGGFYLSLRLGDTTVWMTAGTAERLATELEKRRQDKPQPPNPGVLP